MTKDNYQPLAAKLRPQSIAQFYGQQHILGVDKPLRKAIEQGVLHSMILWGPPGTGKTTLARLIAKNACAHIETLSAVLAGVKEIRDVVKRAQDKRDNENSKTVLFVDEVHRFNKAQQDAFLPFVEDGTLILIGATTENPSFELNSALLSRTRVYVLKPLESNDILQIIESALATFTADSIVFPQNLKEKLSIAADGDARRCLNYLELIIELSRSRDNSLTITDQILKEVILGSTRRFDKGGEEFYNQISALHKAVRGSAPDAALYWLCRMLDGGCDPLFIARRVVRMATEDIGNADPRALSLALDAWDVQERLGSPEGELALAQAVIYMAIAAKSNASYTAFNAAMQDAKEFGSLEVPFHIRNAPTKLMKEIGYGKNYRYAHNENDAYAAGENYFPEKMPKRQYYFPVERGLELKIKEKLDHLRKLDRQKA